MNKSFLTLSIAFSFLQTQNAFASLLIESKPPVKSPVAYVYNTEDKTTCRLENSSISASQDILQMKGVFADNSIDAKNEAKAIVEEASNSEISTCSAEVQSQAQLITAEMQTGVKTAGFAEDAMKYVRGLSTAKKVGLYYAVCTAVNAALVYNIGLQMSHMFTGSNNEGDPIFSGFTSLTICAPVTAANIAIIYGVDRTYNYFNQ